MLLLLLLISPAHRKYFQPTKVSSVRMSAKQVPVVPFSGDPRRAESPLCTPIDNADGSLRKCAISFYNSNGGDPREDIVEDSSDDDVDQSFHAGSRAEASNVLPGRRRLTRPARLNSADVQAFTDDKESAAGLFSSRRLDGGGSGSLRDVGNAHTRHIPLVFLKECAQSFDLRLRLWSELMLYIPFLLLFVFFVIADNNVTSQYFNGVSVKRAAVQVIPPVDLLRGPTWGQTFESLNKLTDASDWLERVVVPLYWRRKGTAPGTAPDTVRLVLGNQIPLGGLVVRIQRRNSVAPVVTCQNVSGGVCSVSVARSSGTQKFGRSASVSTASFGMIGYRAAFSVISHTIGEAGIYEWAGNTLLVPFSVSESDALETLGQLRDNASSLWYGLRDPAIQSMSVVVNSVCPSLALFSRTEFLLETPSSGVVLPSVHYTPFTLFTTVDHRGYAAYTVIYFVVCLLMFCRWLYSIPVAIMAGEFASRVSSVWFYIEAANLVSLIVVFVIRFVWWSESNQNADLLALGSDLPTDSIEVLMKNFELREYIAALYHMQNQINAINTVLFFLLILKYTSLHPTLDRVTNAIRWAQESIVGLLVVFVTILTAFTVGGNALFGAKMNEFRSLDGSISALMRMLLGDSDYDAMRETNELLAGLFYWAFMILGLFLTMNFIMAVIGEALSQEETLSTIHISLKQQYLLLVRGLSRRLRQLRHIFEASRERVKPSDGQSANGSSLVAGTLGRWKVQLLDFFRAMLVIGVVSRNIDNIFEDDNGNSARKKTRLGSTRYVDIMEALDNHRCQLLQRSTKHRPSSSGAQSSQGRSTEPESTINASAVESSVSLSHSEFTAIMREYIAARATRKESKKVHGTTCLSAHGDASAAAMQKTLVSPLSLAALQVRQSLEALLHQQYGEALHFFWRDAVVQYERYLASAKAQQRDDVKRAAWETAGEVMDHVLRSVITNPAEAKEKYPVLQASIDATVHVTEELNRVVDAVVAASAKVEQLALLLAPPENEGSPM